MIVIKNLSDVETEITAETSSEIISTANSNDKVAGDTNNAA